MAKVYAIIRLLEEDSPNRRINFELGVDCGTAARYQELRQALITNR
ncbi:MAG: hypothetical protein ABII79_06545 [bacterium]